MMTEGLLVRMHAIQSVRAAPSEPRGAPLPPQGEESYLHASLFLAQTFSQGFTIKNIVCYTVCLC